MKFELINNHVILNVETDNGVKVCILDTGSPHTVFEDKSVKWCKIEGQVFFAQKGQVAELVQNTCGQLSELVGTKVDGLVGTDTMTGRNVLIDFPSRQFFLDVNDSPLPPTAKMEIFQGLPIFDMTVNGKVMRTAYDSGAMHPFYSRSGSEKLLNPSEESFYDYHPMLGGFTAHMYSGLLQVGDFNLGECKVATGSVYDRLLDMLPCEMFLGNSAFVNRKILLSYKYGNLLLL